MVTSSAPLRVAFWLASVGAHAAAFMAAGHSAASSGAARTDDVALEVAAEPPIAVEDEPPAERMTRSSAFVPPATHTHDYPVPADHDAHSHDPTLLHVARLPARAAAVPTAAPAPDIAPVAPRFAMTVAAGREASGGAAAPVARAGGGEAESNSSPLPESVVSSPARLASPVTPTYPPAARAQEVEADVVLTLVVTSAGTVADAKLVSEAGLGFDEAALGAIRRARFTPAVKDGRPVAVRMRWNVSFRLR